MGNVFGRRTTHGAIKTHSGTETTCKFLVFKMKKIQSITNLLYCLYRIT